MFFGWNTVGGLGVSVFFFLSGFLVWSSWARDPDVYRFFLRRALRIFPGLWMLVLPTVVVLGPLLTPLPLPSYFENPQTWRYLGNAFLWTGYTLPGVFVDNPYPATVNGSLWTLPIEFFCYGIAVAVGCCVRRWPRWEVPLVLTAIICALCASWLGPSVLGERLNTHFEMIACFFWGAGYAVFSRLSDGVLSYRTRQWGLLLLLASSAMGARGFERTAVLICAASIVWGALHTDIGARVTDKLGDISYGVYIFAFPVQQCVVMWGRNRDWSLELHLIFSLVLTGIFAYASWHLVEKRALRLKPVIFS